MTLIPPTLNSRLSTLNPQPQPMASLLPALQRHFDFPFFRPGQTEAVQSLREGRHTLVVMPTGAERVRSTR
jgi:superfamily II DNA helicase RecQ